MNWKACEKISPWSFLRDYPTVWLERVGLHIWIPTQIHLNMEIEMLSDLPLTFRKYLSHICGNLNTGHNMFIVIEQNRCLERL